MALPTQTYRLVHPPRSATYSVEHVEIPVEGLELARGNHADGSRWKLDGTQSLPRGDIPNTPAGKLPATVFRPAHASGKWLLMICGAGDNRFAFKWLVMRKLLERGLTVLTIDPPGHGDFMSVPTTLGNVKNAVRGAADWLHQRDNVLRVGAMGISFGGCQAAWLTAQDARISAVATISAPIELPNVTRSVVMREAVSLALPRNVMLLKHASWPQIWAEWKSMRGAWFGEDLYDMINRFDMLNVMREIGSRPSLIVHGGADVAIPVANARRLFEAARPPRELLIAPQATHITVVLQEQAMTRMAEWLGKNI
jgi:uncharacterized protein